MKATFYDFITQNQNCRKFTDDRDAQRIFSFLNCDDSIIRMLEASDAGQPALAPVARQVELLLEDGGVHTLSFRDSFTKQAVGLMVKTILAPFGYVVWKQKNLPKGVNAAQFRSASAYRRDSAAPATMRYVKRLEEIR